MKDQKIQAMKKYKWAMFVYNLVIYSLSSIITCFFLSYYFCLPSLDHFLSFLPTSVSFFINAKCFFVVGNLIVLVLVGEVKFKQSSSSPAPDIYDEYVLRSRGNLDVGCKVMHGCIEEKKSGIVLHDEKRKGMRKSKSEVWGESGIMKSKGKKGVVHRMSGEEKKIGMRSSKSEVWSVGENVKREKNKVCGVNQEEKRNGMRSCKSEIWGQSGNIKSEGVKVEFCNVSNDEEKRSVVSIGGESEIMKSKEVKEEFQKSIVVSNGEEKGRGMRSSKSAIWGESGIIKSSGGKKEFCKNSGIEKKMGMRSCKSAIWGESENIVKEEDLNKRVEAFIARVNNQRLLEAKLVDHAIA